MVQQQQQQHFIDVKVIRVFCAAIVNLIHFFSGVFVFFSTRTSTSK